MITAQWTSEGSYIIGNSEYGYNLCHVDFTSNIISKLTESEKDDLASEIAKLVSAKTKDAGQKNESIATL